MIRALSLAAALAILPLSAASAQSAPAEAFEVRMEEFGARAELIAEDESLTEQEREVAIMALWAEYQPDVTAFTGLVSENADLIAEQALAEIDLDALIEEALADVDVDALVSEALDGADVDVMAMAGGFASNGAWASTDPEHLATYGLMADYAIGQTEDGLDEMDAALAEVEVELAAVEAEVAAAQAEVDAAAHAGND